MPNAINSRALTGKKPYINYDITRCWYTKNELSVYSHRGYKIIPPSSLAFPFSIIVQLYYNKLVVRYLCLMTSSYLSTLTSSCRETDVNAIFFVHILWCQQGVKCKKEISFRQSRTAGWQRNVLGYVLHGYYCIKVGLSPFCGWICIPFALIHLSVTILS